MQYDIIIIGSGMVGASLACALQDTSLKIAIIDATREAAVNDPRLIALTHGSCCLFKNLGIWPSLKAHAAAIQQIHVSQQGRFGISRIKASDVQLETLGHLVPAKYINNALYEKLKLLKHIDVIRPATLKTLSQTSERVTITIQTEDETKELQTRILIGADGTHSTVRTLVNIPTQTIDYEQSALVTITELQRHHHAIAYERFLKHGAIAMLPLTETTCATIWTDKNDNINKLLQMSNAEFLGCLQKEFGYRLGRFQKIRQRHSYPLKLIVADHYQQHNVLLVGNAAHTLHPIASQGLNLALYEIAELVDYLKQTSAPITLHHYAAKNSQQKISTQLSHRLAQLFSTDLFIINIARQIGLLSLDTCKQAKQFFMHKAMGRAGQIPHLLREREFNESHNNIY